MSSTKAGIALRAEVGLVDALIQKVEKGTLDIALVYTPEYSPGLQVELLLEEKLILVTTDSEGTPGSSRYVRVGWGSDFLMKHDAAFPDLRESGLFVGLGPLALQFILRVGGSGYFRTRAVEPYIEEGKLKKVAGAPEFTYPVYVIYRSDAEIVQSALADLARVIAQIL